MPWRAFDNIEGYWGEANGGCAVIYRFEQRGAEGDHSLLITRVLSDPGMGPYEMTADIAEPGEGDILRAELLTSNAPEETEGATLVFTYANNGSAESLVWDNRTNVVVTPLDRCEEP